MDKNNGTIEEKKEEIFAPENNKKLEHVLQKHTQERIEDLLDTIPLPQDSPPDIARFKAWIENEKDEDIRKIKQKLF